MNRRSERSHGLWKQCFETLIRGVIGALMLTATDALAEPAPAPSPASDSLEEIVVSGDRLSVMQIKPVDSVFGFDKTVLETPRSLTTITNDLLNKTIITGPVTVSTSFAAPPLRSSDPQRSAVISTSIPSSSWRLTATSPSPQERFRRRAEAGVRRSCTRK